MSTKTLVLLKTILGHSPPMLMIILIKLEKKPVCYFPQTLTGGRSTLWHQARLLTLLYGTELFTLTPTLLTKFERCQQWFLKNVFYVPKFAPCQLLLKLSGLWSIDSEIGLRKLLFLDRLLTGDKMAPVVSNLFQIRSQSCFDANIVTLGVLPIICEALHKYGLFSYFDSRFPDSVFPKYSQWKSIVKTKIREFEVNSWKNFVITHPSVSYIPFLFSEWRIYQSYFKS